MLTYDALPPEDEDEDRGSGDDRTRKLPCRGVPRKCRRPRSGEARRGAPQGETGSGSVKREVLR